MADENEANENDGAAVVGKGILTDRVAKALAEGPNGDAVTREGARRAVNATLEAIAAALESGERVQLPGFGTFRVAEQAARTTRVPDGRTVEVAAKPVVRFHASDKLGERVARTA